jgi:hypothetical protein
MRLLIHVTLGMIGGTGSFPDCAMAYRTVPPAGLNREVVIDWHYSYATVSALDSCLLKRLYWMLLLSADPCNHYPRSPGNLPGPGCA